MNMLQHGSVLRALGDVHALGSLGLLGTALVKDKYAGVNLFGLLAEIEKYDGLATSYPFTSWVTLWPYQAKTLVDEHIVEVIG